MEVPLYNSRELLIDPVPFSELAHHLAHAGSPYEDRAIEACVRAAEDARARVAYEDSVGWLKEALRLAGASAPAAKRFELLLALGRAQIRAGLPVEGRATCRDAAELARRVGGADRSAEALARAALEYGQVFVFGEVDPVLVTLLEEALRAQEREDGPLRARLMARLASALQPAPDPEGPIAMAKEAIAMARRLDDRPTLLATLRAGCAAMMDLGDPVERAELNQEHVRLAVELRDPVEALRGAGRLLFDRYEVGDAMGARAAIEEAARFAEELEIPHYRWRVSAFRSMEALRTGALDEHREHVSVAKALAERARDPNAARSLALQEVCRLRTMGRFEEALAADDRLTVHFGSMRFGRWMRAALGAAVLASLGRDEEARARLDPEVMDASIELRDLSLLEPLAHAVSHLDGPREMAERLHETLAPQRARFGSWGMLGLSIGPPVSHSLGQLSLALGRLEEADALFVEARRRLLEVGARAQLGWTTWEHARVFDGRDEERAQALRSEARALLSGLGIETPSLPRRRTEERAAQASRREPAAPEAKGAPAELLRIEEDGELWAVRAAGRTVRLKDSKGVRLLARLVAEPGRAFHVLELSSPTGRSEDVDRSDAGEAIDERAKAAYRARVVELQAELAQAEEWNDPGRAERARGELEALRAELARALGLGGRTRREKSTQERARVNVQRRLRDAIRRIESVDPELGAHLAGTIRTGTHCSYEPDGAPLRSGS